jgi:hypothetical protein
MNLLGRPAVFEDKCDRVLAAWGRGRMREDRVGLPGLERRRLVRLRRRRRIGFIGSGVR